MKKLTTLVLTLLLILTLVPSVYAAGPVETVDVELYLWSYDGEAYFEYENLPYGQTFDVDATDFLDDERFVAWVVDGVKVDNPEDTEFVATSNMKLELIYAPVDEFAAVFVDSNGHVIDVKYVNGATEVTAPSPLPTKPGFIHVTPNPWDKELGLISEDTFYQIQYQLDEDHEFTITVNEVPQLALYNSLVTVTTELSGFTAWLENGVVVSYNQNYTFTALSDRTLVASDDEAYVAAPLVTLLDVTPLRDGYHSLLGQVHLPAGYTLVEAGLLFSYTEEAVVFDNADYVLKSSALHPTTREFLRSVTDDNMTDYVRAYAVVRDAEDNLSTIYSFVENEPDLEELTVTFESNGGSEVVPTMVLFGQKALEPIYPTKESYWFAGWFTDYELENLFDFETAIITDITLYAKWAELKDVGEVSYYFEDDTMLWTELEDAVFYDVYIGDDTLEPITVYSPSINLKPYESQLEDSTNVEVYVIFPYGESYMIFDVTLIYQNLNVVYQTGFEGSDYETGTNYMNNATPRKRGPLGAQWNILNGAISTTSPISGSQSAQMRYYNANIPYVEMDFTIDDIESIKFTAKSSDHHLKVTYQVNSILAENEFLIELTAAPKIYQFKLNAFGAVKVKFELVPVAETNGLAVFVDDVTLYSMHGDRTLVEIPKPAPDDYPETDEEALLALKNSFATPRGQLSAPAFSIPLSNEGLLNYYASLNDLTGAAFRTELQNILISTHTRLISYNEARFVLEQADLVTDEEGRQYLDGIYSSTKIVKYWDGGATWAREHVWPNSRLAMDRVEGGQRNQASDVHNLRAINPSVNSSRSNRYFDQGLSSLNQLVGTTAYYPGDEYIGDVARILFYMVVRYHNILTLADTGIDDYPAYSEEGAIMGILTLLLEWHELDPVSDFEIRRNDIIYSYQGNRNPFIDFPEYAEVYFG